MRTLPVISIEDEHFWTGGAEDRLQFKFCPNCDYYLHPPGPVCPRCLNSDLEVKPVSGQAVVHTFTINYQPWLPDMAVPYVIAIVELEEQQGLRLTTNIIDCEVDQVQIGMPVEVVFEHVEDVWLPLFRPRQS